MNRRQFCNLGIGSALLTLPRLSSATIAGSDRKFIFIRVPGGWDTTRVFAPMFHVSGIEMEDEASLGQSGGISYVSHESRPIVDQFFADFSSRTAIVNGLIVPSVNHAICDRLLYSDSSTGSVPDWGTQIASANSDRYSLPHVLISGRAMAGNRANLIVNVGTDGQMSDLLSGRLMSRGDLSIQTPARNIQELIAQRLLTSLPNSEFGTSYTQSLQRMTFMRDISEQGLVNWQTDGSMTSQIGLTKDLLVNDLSRCITMEFTRTTFDSHADNESKQMANYQDLFAFLYELVFTLHTTTGVAEPTLLDETCIVVLSEMGRTPYLNGGKGKDHWQHTSAMFVGSGIRGGQVIGDYSDLFYGQSIDLSTGAVFDQGQDISTRLLGDTLLALGDVGNEFTPLGEPIWALMS